MEEEQEEEEEEKTETFDGASESVKQEERQSAPIATFFPQTRKTTAGRNKKIEEGATTSMGGLSLWARGAEAFFKQVQNIENMIGNELADIKTASLQIAIEKERLELELKELRSEEPAAKKRKVEPSEMKEQQDLKEALKSLTNTVQTLQQNLAQKEQDLKSKEQEHKEEKLSWSEEVQTLKNEQEATRIMLLQLFKYIRDRDAVIDSNWAAKFKGQPRFPQFPDILPPEAITGGPDEGASNLGEQ